MLQHKPNRMTTYLMYCIGDLRRQPRRCLRGSRREAHAFGGLAAGRNAGRVKERKERVQRGSAHMYSQMGATAMTRDPEAATRLRLAMDGADKSPKVPGRPLFALLVLGAVLVPLAYIPYFPIRHHLRGLGRSIDAVSANVTDIQQGLLTKGDVYKELAMLASEIRDLRVQLHAATHKATDSENARLKFQREVTEQLRAASLKITQTEVSRLRTEEVARQKFQCLKAQIDRDRCVLPVSANCLNGKCRSESLGISYWNFLPP